MTETARALRALFLNIVGDTKTEIDEGVTWTTGEIEGLRDVIKVYAKDAYDAAQATGSIIDPMKAMEGLSKSLKDGLLSEQELMQMVSDIGGKLRTSQLLALINNWDMYESMLNDYRNAYGSADKEVENAMDSWSRKTNVLKNTWTEFVKTGLDSSQMKGFLDVLTWIVERLDSLPGVLTRLIMLMAAFNLDHIAEGVGNLVTRIANLSTGLTIFGGVLAGIAVAWGVVSFAVESHKRALEEARKATEESIKATQSDIKMLDDLKKRYLEIVDSTATAAEKDKQLTEFKKQLVEQYGFEKKAVEQINLERQTGIDLLNKEAEASLRRTLSDNSGTFHTASGIYNGTTSVSTSMGHYLPGISILEELTRAGAIIEKSYSDLNRLSVAGENLRETYENLGKVIDILQKKQLSRNGLTEAEAYLLEDLRERYADLGTQMDQYGTIYEDGIKLQAQYILMSENVSEKVIQSKDAFDGLKRTLKETYGADKDLWEAMNLLLNETFPEFQEAVEETTDTVEGETKSFWANTEALDENADSTKRLQAAKADAEAAVRNLLPVLFDEEGNLTDVGIAALEASDYLADLVQAEINVQNETARANYANIRAQLAALSTDAVRAAMSIIAAYNAAQAAREMGYSVGNLGYDREHLPAGTLDAYSLLQQLAELEAIINSTSIQASNVGHYGSGGSSSSGGSSGGHSSGGSSGGHSSTNTTDPKLEALRERVALLRSELELLRAQNASDDDIIGKIREIMAALQNQANYMTSIGESQVDINGLLTDYYNYQNQINEILEDRNEIQEEETEEETDQLEVLREHLAVLQSRLELLQAQGASEEDRARAIHDILNAIDDEIAYLRSIGASEEEINRLIIDRIGYENQLNDLLDEEERRQREAHQAEVSRLESRLDLLQAQGADEEQQAAAIHQIINAINNEIFYLRSIGASEEEINRLLIDRIRYENQLNDLYENRGRSRLNAYSEQIELYQSALDLLQERGENEEQQAQLIRNIITELDNEIAYLYSIGASQTEINRLLLERIRYENQLNDLLSKDPLMESLNGQLDLLQSELALQQENGSHVRVRIATMQEIMDILQREIDHLTEIGGDQVEINRLTTEWWRYHNQISDLMDQEAESANQIADALERARDAQEALNNAMRERNVHIYNAATGQWEWAANPSAVAAAQDELDEARAAIPQYTHPYGPRYKSSLFAPKGGTSIINGGTKNYGATYNIGGINISEADAKSMSLYQLLQLSKSLGIYKRTN